ncbi:hypothetical protein D9M71_765370 [compost metagenome]
MVVPVFQAHKGALPLAVETEIAQALDGLRDRVAFLEVKPVVVGADPAAIGMHALGLQGIGAGHQVFVGALGRPAAAQAQGASGGKAPVFIEVERGRLGRRGDRRQDGQDQR